MNNDYSTFGKITADYIVAGAKMKLRIKDSSEDDLYLSDLVNLGVKRIRNLGTLIPAISQIPVVNLKAKLPIGFSKFVHPYPIIFTDSQGGVLMQGSVAPNFVNNAFFTDSPFKNSNVITAYGGTVTMVDGYLFFGTNIGSATHVKIAYLSTSLDNDGNILIPAIAEDAITAFVCWNYTRTYSDKYSALIMQSYELEWKKGKQHLKGIFNGPQGYDTMLIAYEMNAMV